MKLFLYLGDAKANLSTLKKGARTVGLFVVGSFAVFALIKYLIHSLGPLMVVAACVFVLWKLYRWGKGSNS